MKEISFHSEKNWDTNSVPSSYRMTELGPLPEDWEVVRLGEVIENMKQGKILPTSEILEYGAHPVYGANGIIGYYSKSFVPKNKVLITCRGSTCGTVNFTISDAFVTNNAMIIYEDKTKVYWLWLYYCLQEFSTEVLKTGSGQPQITKGRLLEFKIPLPPLPEQKAIARVLKTIQDTIEATDKVIESTKELKKSLMQHLFTYGPVPVAERDKVRLKQTEIGFIPGNWKVVRLGDVCENIKQGKILPTSEILEHGMYPVYGANGIIGYYSKGFVPKNKVLITCRGSTCGTVNFTISDAFVTNNAMIIYEDKTKVYWLWLYYCLQEFSTEVLKTGSGQPQITKGRLLEFKIPLPPLPIQQKIAQIIKAVDDKIEAEEKRKEALQVLFKTMLHHLMTGKIRLQICWGGEHHDPW